MNEKEVQDYINRLITLQKNGDPEIDHAEADNILCKIITQLGYPEIVKEYDKIEKCYI